MLLKRYVASEDTSAFMEVLPIVSAWGNGPGFGKLVDDEDD